MPSAPNPTSCHSECPDGVDLFDFSALSVPVTPAPARTELPPRSDARPRLRSIQPFSTLPSFGLTDQQLHFTWTEAVSAEIVPLLGNRRLGYLDFGVYDFLRDVPKVRSAARGLEQAGICLIGQLVQIRETDLRILKCMTPDSIEAIACNLRSVGLSFGMCLPLWNRDARMPVTL